MGCHYGGHPLQKRGSPQLWLRNNNLVEIGLLSTPLLVLVHPPDDFFKNQGPEPSSQCKFGIVYSLGKCSEGPLVLVPGECELVLGFSS
jgi:hypothetical protein